MSKTILIDNYDSFSFNIVHAFEAIQGHPITVVKNDKIDLEQLKLYDNIVLSPGPGLPSEAGQMNQVIEKMSKTKKILGICLGLQAIAEVYGSDLRQLETVFHGIQSQVTLTRQESKLYKGIPESFRAGRYHSWVIDETTLGPDLEVSARDEEGQIMSIEHKYLPIYAVQFHPESIMTPLGKRMIQNFLDI